MREYIISSPSESVGLGDCVSLNIQLILIQLSPRPQSFLNSSLRNTRCYCQSKGRRTHSVVLVMIPKCLPYSCKVHECGNHHKNVKDVVRASPNVEFSRSNRFRKPSGVEHRAENVDGALQQIVGHTSLFPGLMKAIYDSTMNDRCKSR